MDESRNLSESGAGQMDAQDTTRVEPNMSTNGEADNLPPRPASRTITSKRVVIPANAKRAAKSSPPPAVVPIEPTHPPVEHSGFAPNGETASTLDAPTVVEPPPASEPAPVFVPTEPIAPPPPTPTYQAEPQAPATPAESATNISAPVDVPAEPTTRTDAKPLDLKPSPIVPAKSPAQPSSPTVKPSTPTTQPTTSKGGIAAPTGGLKPTGLPYAPSPSTFTPLAEEAPRKRRGLEFVLWTSAIVFLIGAVVLAAYFLQLIPGFGAPEAIAPTRVAVTSPTAQPQPSATTTLLPTAAPTSLPPVPTSAPLIIPTPPLDGQQKSLVSNSRVTGWFSLAEPLPHYGDDNLHAGILEGQSLSSVLQFPLDNLPTDTQVLFAAIELTGRAQTHLGTSGTWQLELIENSLETDWLNATPEQLAAAKSLGTIGAPLDASELGAGRLNRFILTETELDLLEQQFKNGNAVFRLRGPEGSSENLFTWESGATGSALNAPTLHLVYTPGKYVIVTLTPAPQNVLTAAAYVVRGTDQAKRNGTPTRFPPGVATATPGGGIVTVAAETAIPGNVETAVARTRIADAVARTTGTFTPIPQTVIIIFPTLTPVVFTEDLATATPIPPDTDLLTIPIDYERCDCKGRILVISDRFGGEKGSPIMLAPDGTELGKLSGDLYYRLALAREPYSPDRTKRLIYPPNANGVQQIGYEDVATGEITFISDFPKGIAYDAVWSPDGNYIAFVSTERGNTDEIFVYDFGTDLLTRITDVRELGQPWSKRPSWSPDSQEIAFWSSRSGTPQIWIMNRDGSNLRNISNNAFNERDPVWVK
jgi:hypothetical protein